jgi:hypothetical protein
MSPHSSMLGLAALAAIGLVLVTAGPAAAVGDPQLVTQGSFPLPDPTPNATAQCPDGTRVVGGGGRVFDGEQKQGRLTALDPSFTSFRVEAESPDETEDIGNWRVFAYAICADRDALEDYQIVSRSRFDASTFKDTAARCPSGTVAYGAGARVVIPGTGGADGRIGLQLNRTSGPLDISRATGRVDTRFGSVGNWTLSSEAICAKRAGGIHVEGDSSFGASVSESCDAGTVHGPGGGGGLTDGGLSWLYSIQPFNNLQSVNARMTSPLNPSIGGMIAHFTCAT